MRANAKTDTAPEIALRRALWSVGVRYRCHRPVRVHGRLVRPDIVFAGRRVAVFVDGCFWHQCPEHGTMPRANAHYWGPKLASNVRRDRLTDSALLESGWTVVRVWEHQPASEGVMVVLAALGG